MRVNFNNKFLLLSGISIAFGWILSFAYEGPVMYAFIENSSIDGSLLNLLSTFFIGIGLIMGGFMAKGPVIAKKRILIILLVSFAFSILIMWLPIKTWIVFIPLLSLLMGMTNSGAGTLVQYCIKIKNREKAAANILIIGNLVLVISDIISSNFHAVVGYAFVEIMFFVGIYFVSQIDLNDSEPFTKEENKLETISLKKFWIFFLFIFIITINSGIMFAFIYPYFQEFTLLVSVYTNVPYIVAIFLLAYVIKGNRLVYLYLGLLLWAITFGLFAIMGQTPLAFVIVCTCMLFACGIFDIFWWATMFQNLELVKYPSSLLGIGLALNVFGVWIGTLIVRYIFPNVDKQMISIIGLLVVVLSLIIIMPLNLKLSGFLTHNLFLLNIRGNENENAIDIVKKSLTKREWEVFLLLRKGMTDPEICDELIIAQSTVKSHCKNIYRKLDVKNRKVLSEIYKE